MSANGLEVFDRTLQSTNGWLGRLMEDLGTSRQEAWHILGAVLRLVRDRLPVDHAAHFGAELPMLIRGHYYDQYRPAGMPEKWRTDSEFVEKLEKGLDPVGPVEPKRAAVAVFGLITRELDAGLVVKIRDAMPEDVREAWPVPAA